MDKEYMTIKQVSKHFGYHPNTIRRWIRAGKLIPAKYPGRRIVFDKEQIESLTK